MTEEKLVLGVDYGTDSVRVLVVDAATGAEKASAVAPYQRWAQGKYCDPGRNMFRQHPRDYTEGLVTATREALGKLPPGSGDKVVGIGIDTTGSTPCAVDENGTPLAWNDDFHENPNGMFVLWKDHTAVAEAEEINHLARTWGGTDFTRYSGGIYSSEWFWAKILHVTREDAAVRKAAFSWVEHCDWMVALLTGTTNPKTMKRSRCAAGHKAMWHEEWGGLPEETFLTRLDPLLAGMRDRLYTRTDTADVKAGELVSEWAGVLGLKPGIAVAVGAFDAHIGAVGGGVKPEALVKIMGTSTCDVMMADPEVIKGKLIRGICGQVDGSVLPGYIGLEAGQSAFGDVYAWFRRLMAWPLGLLETAGGLDREMATKLKHSLEQAILPQLTVQASSLTPGEAGVVALDWLNGRRTPDADQTMKGAIAGLTLGTDAPVFFRSLIESTAYGARAIVDRFREEGVKISEVIAMGGIPKKSELVMQITTDVLEMPIKVVQSEQACALGAAMFGAVAAGVYDSVMTAQARMASGFSHIYTPSPSQALLYREGYARYRRFGELLEKGLK